MRLHGRPLRPSQHRRTDIFWWRFHASASVTGVVASSVSDSQLQLAYTTATTTPIRAFPFPGFGGRFRPRDLLPTNLGLQSTVIISRLRTVSRRHDGKRFAVLLHVICRFHLRWPTLSYLIGSCWHTMQSASGHGRKRSLSVRAFPDNFSPVASNRVSLPSSIFSIFFNSIYLW